MIALLCGIDNGHELRTYEDEENASILASKPELLEYGAYNYPTRVSNICKYNHCSSCIEVLFTIFSADDKHGIIDYS